MIVKGCQLKKAAFFCAEIFIKLAENPSMTSHPVIGKLKLDSSLKALVINAPKSFTELLNFDVETALHENQKGIYDYVHIFACTQAELESLCQSTAGFGKYDCLFWASYPKGTGKIKSDIKREGVWKAFENIGFDTVTQVAIDETWERYAWKAFRNGGKGKEMMCLLFATRSLQNCDNRMMT